VFPTTAHHTIVVSTWSTWWTVLLFLLLLDIMLVIVLFTRTHRRALLRTHALARTLQRQLPGAHAVGSFSSVLFRLGWVGSSAAHSRTCALFGSVRLVLSDHIR